MGACTSSALNDTKTDKPTEAVTDSTVVAVKVDSETTELSGEKVEAEAVPETAEESAEVTEVAAPVVVETKKAEEEKKNKLPALKKGFINKEGHLVKNWKTRFFVLEAGALTYYENTTDAYPYGVNQKGEIQLKGMKITTEGDFIQLQGQESGNNLKLEIKVAAERAEWFAAIKSHIDYIQNAESKSEKVIKV